MTTEQAIEIREHLIAELNRNGFSDIVNEVNARIEEDYQEETFERSPRFLLTFFLEEAIDVIDASSNKNYENIINRLNEFIISERQIEGVSVELLNQGQTVLYDLANLPNYSELIEILQEVLNEIRNEN